ncbi:hypothetical protein RRG08_027378 [Elysia crispata]|uniref:Uncharacterized protein n=1 Tax=Elysia crispata TaxID=231223 RepID=A0AAE0YL71_9GAST|nr:hypothetical protein RRG08_027378 [Elysia crispata]
MSNPSLSPATLVIFKPADPVSPSQLTLLPFETGRSGSWTRDPFGRRRYDLSNLNYNFQPLCVTRPITSGLKAVRTTLAELSHETCSCRLLQDFRSSLLGLVLAFPAVTGLVGIH